MAKCKNCKYFIVEKGSFNGEFTTETDIDCQADRDSGYQLGYIDNVSPDEEHDCPEFKREFCYKTECSKESIGIMIITYRDGGKKKLPICKTHELINKAYVETTITNIEMEYYENESSNRMV